MWMWELECIESWTEVKVTHWVRLFATPWAIHSMEFARPEWVGSLFLLQGTLLLLLLLNCFSRVRLCETPERTVHQAPPFLRFSRQEYWSGVPFPSPMKVKSENEVAQSCLTFCDPMDCSLTGSSIHGIFQASVLEWGAIAFSDIFINQDFVRFLHCKFIFFLCSPYFSNI